jgi:hypothetical protein
VEAISKKCRIFGSKSITNGAVNMGTKVFYIRALQIQESIKEQQA